MAGMPSGPRRFDLPERSAGVIWLKLMNSPLTEHGVVQSLLESNVRGGRFVDEVSPFAGSKYIECHVRVRFPRPKLPSPEAQAAGLGVAPKHLLIKHSHEHVVLGTRGHLLRRRLY
jgi:hypothetical protein